MKRIIPILILSVSAFPALAQNEEKSVTLDEVTVKGAKVVSKVMSNALCESNKRAFGEVL